MAVLDRVDPKTIDKNVASIMYYMQDMKMCTQKTMGERMGVSPQSAGAYLNECVERGLLRISRRKRPLTYSLPSSEVEPAQDPADIFEHSGKTTHLSIYVDESVAAKIKALSVMRHGAMYGGQGSLVSALVENEFARIPKTHHDTLAKLIETVEDAEDLKSQIPRPIEWEGGNAQSHSDES